MAGLPQPIVALVASLSRLPGIGPRSAERVALHLVQADPAVAGLLAEVIIQARKLVGLCATCGGLTECQPCAICSDDRRDSEIVCLVERPTDILNLERAGGFRGRYHVLGGRISPLNGIGPEDLRIEELEKRLKSGIFRELILALGSDVDGEATCHYLSQRFLGLGLKLTRIAQGLPVGSGLEFADELTLNRALEGRRTFE